MHDVRLGWLAIAACALLACGDATRQSGPNFLILIADDQAAATLGAAGDAVAHTPRLDALAAEGVRFRNSFVTTSLCSPARASYLTGQSVRRHGLADNFTPLPEGVPTFASELSRAGYETGYVGKWHLGERAEARPGFGFSASFGGQGRYFDCPFYVAGRVRETTGHVDDVSTDFAVEFLRRPRSAPFALVVGFKGLHVPRTPPERLEGLFEDTRFEPPANLEALPPYPRRDEYAVLAGAEGEGFQLPQGWARGFDRTAHAIRDAQLQRAARKYYRSLAAVDDNVGRLLDEIDELGLRDDTVVVYLSDNGTHRYAQSMTGKRSAYEESMRVETLVRDPRSAHGARTVDALVLNIDLAPTLLDLAGLEIPASMQGRSWRPLLEGTGGGTWRDAFLYEYYRGSFPYVPTHFALRTRTAKLVHYPGYPGWTQLFDLRRDPGEASNLAADPQRASELAGLRDRLAALERQLGPRLE
jgi:arylsulfatase A-like enzyme